MPPIAPPAVPAFDRRFFDGTEQFTRIGSGALGGKAHSPAGRQGPPGVGPRRPPAPPLRRPGADADRDRHRPLRRLHGSNRLWDLVHSGASDHRIALAFQDGGPAGRAAGRPLRAGPPGAHAAGRPLLEPARGRAGPAVRRRLRDEDDPQQPARPETRFRKLVEAIKFVYASTFFENARNYRRLTGHASDDRMAVIIQEIVGTRHGDRFYPDLSGVARSYNFYRSGNSRPEDGVVNLALGLGKTIVDGGMTWSYSPAYPQATPPYSSVRDLLRQTQLEFWAVNMGSRRLRPDGGSRVPCEERGGRRRGGRDAAAGRLHLRRALGPPLDGRRHPGPARPDVRAAARAGGVPLNDLLKRCCALPGVARRARGDRVRGDVPPRGRGRPGPARLPAGAADDGVRRGRGPRPRGPGPRDTAAGVGTRDGQRRDRPASTTSST